MLNSRVYTFLTVCEYMNYTKAAGALHITQPTMSQHARYLETLYGVRLFTSKEKKIHLTPAGKRLLQASTTLEDDEEFLREVLRCVPEQGPTLRFGTTRTVGESVVPMPLTGYIHHHPEANIRVAIGSTDELLHKLTSGKIQFTLVEGYYDQQAYDSLVYCIESFVSMCATRHQFKENPEQLKGLLEEHLLVREPGSETEDILEENLEIKNIRLGDFTHMTEVGSIHIILQLLEKDSGITFLHRTAMEQEIQDGTIGELRLRDFQMEYDSAFIQNKGNIYGDEYREICRELQ